MNILLKSIAIILLATTFFINCGNKSKIDNLKRSKKKLLSEISKLNSEVKQIDDQLATLENKDITNYPLVNTLEIKADEFSNNSKFLGNLETDNIVNVNAESNGMIIKMMVAEGSFVKAGQTLAILDQEILQKNIEELKNSLKYAEYMYNKQVELQKAGLGKEIDLEQAKNQKESIEKRISTMKSESSKYKVIAPINGKINKLYGKLGTFASPQIPFAEVVNTGNLKARVEISESLLKNIRIGMDVDVTIPSLNKTFYHRKIVDISNVINPNNRTIKVDVSMPSDGNLKVNQGVEVNIKSDIKTNTIVIPIESIIEDSKGNKFVFLFENGIARKRKINVSNYTQENANLSEESEIHIGDNLIVKGANSIIDGEKVRILK